MRQAATLGIGALGTQLAVLGVEAVAGGADVFQDIAEKLVDGLFSCGGGDVVQARRRDELQGRLEIGGVGVYGDTEPRALAPDRDVRPMVSGPDGRQVVGKAPFGAGVVKGRRFVADAPPVVDEPESERDGRRLQTVVGLIAAPPDQAGEVGLAEPDGESARSGWVVRGERLYEDLEVGHYRNPYRSRQESLAERSSGVPCSAAQSENRINTARAIASVGRIG